MPLGEDSIELLECAACGLRWFFPMIAGGPEFYEALQQHDWYYQIEKPEYPHAAALIAPGSDVLEVGCGRGAFASHLKQVRSYRGLEFNLEAVRKAIVAGLDVTQTPVEEEAARRPGHYDLVCHFQVLEHVPESLGFMQACVAALKPGGMLLVTVPAEDSFLSVATSAWLNMPPHHVTRWTDKALSQLFSSLGLTVTHVWHEPVADFHRDWYQATMRYFGLARMLGHRVALDDQSVLPRIARRLGRSKWFGQWLFNRGESRFGYRLRGHSVCFAGVKKG